MSSSSRQKSFFDQDHGKAHKKWTGGNYRNHNTNESRPSTVPVKSPIKASTQSRTKLQAFALSTGHSATARQPSDKENDIHGLLRQYQPSDKENKRESHSPETETSETTPSMSQTMSYPSTPAMRLPLADLIGNAEEALRRPDEPKEQSPEEKIGWMNSSHPDLTPRQKRRRAQSSSPLSSSQDPTANPLAKHAMDLKSLQQTLKTPRIISDPAADLWARYATARNMGGADGKPPSFAHLIESSSPRSGPRTPGGSVGGLRRWTSCGIDFPASKTKRRRVNGVFRDRHEVHQGQDMAKQKPTSRVGMLLEKVQADLDLTSNRRRDAPSSSSPLPDKVVLSKMVDDVSPIARRRHGSSQLKHQSQSNILSQPSVPSVHSPGPEPPESDTMDDEFGVDDLEIDADDAVPKRSVQSVHNPDPENHESDTMDDEFGDDNLDIDVDDAAPKRSVPSVNSPAPENRESDLMDDDTVDDDFGDDDLDIDLDDAVPIRPGATLPDADHQNSSTAVPLVQHHVPPQQPRNSPHLEQALDGPQNELQPQDSRMETIEEESDEFGDDDFDITLEDMDTAVPLYDSRSSSRTQTGNLSAAHSRSVSLNQANYTPVAGTKGPERTSNAVPQQSASVAVTDQEQVPVDLTGFSDDDDDEFGGSDLDDDAFAQAEQSATQAAHQASGATSNAHNLRKSRAIQRYLVMQVIEGQYTNDKGRVMPEKVLLVEDGNEKRAKTVTLRQSWFDTHCTAGSYVHVVGDFTKLGQINIDDAENLLIVHPDHLISATVVADSFECIRRAVLQDRVKATSNSNEYNVYGTILHEIFQEALKANKWDTEWLDQLAETTLSKFLEKLFEIGHDGTGKALEFLRSKMPEVSSWAQAYVKAKPGPDALADDRNGKKVRLSIKKLLDVEEHVWSPTYGLKGNIDATVQTVIQDEEGERSLTVPFEVKTGRNTSSASHRAQTALYTLLLSDRYDINILYGVLYYMETSTIHRIPAIRNELRHMIMQRNELASYVRERLQLPPMLQNPHKCGRCYAKTQCFLYHKLAEGGTSETAGVKEKFDELVGRLQPAHQDFFKKWDDLLTKEESEMMKFRRELWTMLSQEREQLGRCFSDVVIEPGSGRENKDMAKINRFSYTFLKKESRPGFSFTESQITIGEPIVISSEQGHFALANGYVTKVSSRRISVVVDRRLHNARRRLQGFDATRNQNFAGIMEVTKEDEVPEDPDEIPVYRLDKDEFSNGMATVRNNLLSIMDDNVYRSSELRALIVEHTPPTFKPAPSKYELPTGQMNPDQRAAIDKVMSAQDYALVLGMPGTGKTTTIAQIIQALVARGKSVLLTSYTHTAVDNILLKLRSPAGKKQEPSILRLGTPSKIHPEVQDFANLGATPKYSLEEIQDAYMTPQVVATTCLGISHFLFQKRVFDYCIVDEASQITLPVCLGPIRMARTFVLVGDHNQLPPLVQNKEAAEGGLDVSLFKLLSDEHPEAVVELGRQYRMCEDIQVLSNTLIYSGKLQCGNLSVANHSLHLSGFPSGLDRYHRSTTTTSSSWHDNSTSSLPCPGVDSSSSSPTCWLSDLLNPAHKVVFADTDTLTPTLPPRLDHSAGRRIINATEATLVTQLVLSLLSCGVPASEIGVITFYRSQLALLRQTLKAYASGAAAEFLGGGVGGGSTGTSTLADWQQVEMHTCDKFQGRDKDVVIVSCVRSNEAGNVGDLLKDWRRINVAVTRAKSKLLMVGSAGTLGNDKLLAEMIALLKGRGWVRGLREGCESSHAFEVGGTAPSGVEQRDEEPKSPHRYANAQDETMQHRKASTMKKGIDAFLLPKEQTAPGKENADIEDFSVVAVNKLRNIAGGKQKPFKMPLKTIGSRNGGGAITSKVKKTEADREGKERQRESGNKVLRDIVNDVLGDGDEEFVCSD